MGQTQLHSGDIRGIGKVVEMHFGRWRLSHLEDFALLNLTAQTTKYPIVQTRKDIIALLNLGKPLGTDVAT